MKLFSAEPSDSAAEPFREDPFSEFTRIIVKL